MEDLEYKRYQVIVSLLILVLLLLFVYIYYIHNVLKEETEKEKKETTAIISIIMHFNKLISFHTYLNHMGKEPQKTNIVIFMSFSYTTIPYYAPYTIEMTRRYCEKHGYQFIVKDHKGQNTVSPFWIRVYDLIEMMQLYTKDTTFVYFDLDAFINPKYHSIRIEDLLYTIDIYHKHRYSVYIGKDPSPDYLVNTGVFFVRNNETAKKIVSKWVQRYDPSMWEKNESGKWICKVDNDKECDFALDGYEQQELSNLYIEDEFTKLHTRILHGDICANMYLKVDSFIYHFMNIKPQASVFQLFLDQT